MVRSKREKNSRLYNSLHQITKSSGIQSKVGWFESAVYEDGTPVAYVASVQEFGSPKNNIQSRSFMRTAEAENESKWAKALEIYFKRVTAGSMSMIDAMESMALIAEGDVAKKITEISSPPLSPVTLILRKWRDENPDLKVTEKTIGQAAYALNQGPVDLSGISMKPLVDSSYMLSTLTSTVEQ